MNPRSSLVRLGAALALVARLSASPAAGDEEALVEFRKYFKQFTDTASRVEAIRALEGTQVPGVVDALKPVLKDRDEDVVREAVLILAGFTDASTVAYLRDSLGREKDERVRIGLLEAIAQGAYPAEEVVEPLLSESSPEVRRKAIAALAVPANPPDKVGPRIAPMCQDPSPEVRCSAFDALSSLGSESAVEPAIAALSDSSWRVRSSAVAALGRVRRKASIPPLLARMEQEEGRLRSDIAAALESITGRRYGERIELWKEFWQQHGEVFVIPSDAELAELRAKQEAAAERYNPTDRVQYHGIATPSRRIVFVIDVSGSMEHLVTQQERFEGGGYPSFKRIDIVKTELMRTVENLDKNVEFNVLAFATDVYRWKKRAVVANVLNKSSALSWIERQEAIGGSSKADLSHVGLVQAANLEGGKTNTYDALVAALTEEDPEQQADTVFFLSDGQPSTGKYVDPGDILREVRNLNAVRRVVIHTIALGQFDKSLMRRLAEENGGSFVDLGE
jgi:HEAT repeat protein